MKKLYFLVLLFIASVGNAQQGAFITTWQTNTILESILIPIPENPNNNYSINFGDGTILYNQTGPVQHTYINPGIYTVTINGQFSTIYINAQISESKFRTIEQWGSNLWTTMYKSFYRCNNLTINATDAPNLTQVTNMSSTFFGCSTFNQSINHWDVSNVTDMTDMFSNCDSFNQPLDNWNVSNVTNMKGMFFVAGAFSQPLNNWNVSSVTNMNNMFYGSAFNQLLDNWDVSNVINMTGMFKFASFFNQSIGSWDTSNVTSMSGIFESATAFNQSIENWDVSNVTNMSNMFRFAVSFNQPLDNWNVSNVTNMKLMFNRAESFNQPLNNWNVSNVTNMNSMFYTTDLFNQPLNNWNVSNVLDMDKLFFNSDSFNQDISGWNFHNNVYFGEEASFLPYNFSTENYDSLLLKFVQLGLENKIFRADQIEYCNIGVHTYLTTNLGWNINDSGLSPECIGNNITGKLQFDQNANGCDEGDVIVSNFLVSASNDTFDYSSTTDNEGNYTTNVPEGNYSVALLNVPDYYSVTPASSQFTFTGVGNEQNINFCLTASEAINDLNITLLPITEARPGFEAQYQLIAENIGTQTIANTAVTLNFNEAMQTFVSASPAPAATTANQLTFATGTIQPLQSKVINFIMQTFEPPVVNSSDMLNFTAIINPDTTDATPQDNTYTLNQLAVNSYDPNDKRIVQGDEITMAQAEGYLDYIIRFQNTGTASAINVRVVDTLNPLLNWRTLKPISSSHNYTVKITDGNKAEFIFNNINLPHEAADGPGSNGYIAYKIKPVSTIQVGNIISTDASIYFDYNLPIITNIATTEVITVLSSKTFSTGSRVMLYPNPASTIVYIKTEAGNTVNAVSVYNLQGRELLHYNSNPGHIDIDNLQTGVYLVNLTTAQGTVSYRLIKK